MRFFFKFLKQYKHLLLCGPNRQSVYVGNNMVLTSTLCSQKLYVDTRDVSLSPHIIIDGYWESWVTRAIQRLVKPGMIVVEIGANIGYYTTLNYFFVVVGVLQIYLSIPYYRMALLCIKLRMKRE